MPISKTLIKEIFEWDSYNWSKALPFWDDHLKGEKLHCLELGAHRGGPSLWLSIKGQHVICSDLRNPQEQAKAFHDKHDARNITYSALSATSLPFENEFDVIIFKSILGGISRNGKDELKSQAIGEMYKALKPGGILLFAENLKSSVLHRFFRSRLRKWGNSWNYLEYRELTPLLSDFSKVEMKTTGFFSALGPNEFSKKLLGMADSLLSPLIPPGKKYIVFVAATK